MTKPMIREHNTETNEIIDREMTDDEFEMYQKDLLAQEAARESADTKAAEKAALLAQLGITADQAKLLLS